MRKYNYINELGTGRPYVNNLVTVYGGDYDYQMLSEAVPLLRGGALTLRTLEIQGDVIIRANAAAQYLSEVQAYSNLSLFGSLFKKAPSYHFVHRPDGKYDDNLKLLDKLTEAIEMYKDHPDMFIFVDEYGILAQLRQV